MTQWSGRDFVSDKKKNEPVRDINALSPQEYEERIVKPNQERSRQRILSIESARAENTRRSRAAERRRKAGRSLFEIYADEPQIPGWFDEPRIFED